MRPLHSRPSPLVLTLLSLLTSQVLAQCNTNQNPYCAGNSKFEQLCCPYPAVCYWSDRYGDAGCCEAGQVCVGNGNGVTITPTLIPGTPITTGPTATTPNGGYHTVTVTGGVAGNTNGGYTTTAGVIIANDASKAIGLKHAAYFASALTMLACIFI